MKQEVPIGDFTVGSGRTFVIAEIGINHNGDVALAKEMILAAHEAGADAVKFQSFRAETLCDKGLTETKDIKKITKGSDSSFQMYKALELSKNDHEILLETAREAGICFLSSVFDEEMVDYLDGLGVAAFKISSGDVTHHPLIERAAGKGKPLIISTGMADLNEVAEVLEVCRKAGNKSVILLHCNALYPPDYEEINLKSILLMKAFFKVPVGFSDHSMGTVIPPAAVAIGSSVIEKHFTLDNKLPGPDQKLSLNKNDFKKMVTEIRVVEKALGREVKTPSMSEKKGRFPGRRSIWARCSIPAGSVIDEKLLKIIKPAAGISPRHFRMIIGRKAKHTIEKNKPILWDDLS